MAWTVAVVFAIALILFYFSQVNMTNDELDEIRGASDGIKMGNSKIKTCESFKVSVFPFQNKY